MTVPLTLYILFPSKWQNIASFDLLPRSVIGSCWLFSNNENEMQANSESKYAFWLFCIYGHAWLHALICVYLFCNCMLVWAASTECFSIYSNKLDVCLSTSNEMFAEIMTIACFWMKTYKLIVLNVYGANEYVRCRWPYAWHIIV